MTTATRSRRVHQSAMPRRVVTEESKWELFHEAWADCELICRELAKYQYYWDARTVWLMEHADAYETPLFQERREKRNAMAARWNDLRLDFTEAARRAAIYADYLGPEQYGAIWERFGVDYAGRRGNGIDVYLHQWREWLTFNPEKCPF